MDMVLDWALGIWIVLCMAYHVCMLIIRLITIFKCRKIMTCHNRRCMVNCMCGKYSDEPTEKEWEEIEQMLNEFRESIHGEEE